MVNPQKELNEFYRELEHLSLNAGGDEDAIEALRTKLVRIQPKVDFPKVGNDLEEVFRSVGDLLRNAMRTIDDQIRPTRKAEPRS